MMNKFSIEDIKGVIPALITPFKENGDLDLDGVRIMCRFLTSFEIGGLYVGGSTGEAFLMRTEERKRVLEAVMEEVGDKVPVVAHIGDIGTNKAIELAKHAESVGATAISSVPPFYWRFTEKQIFNYYNDVSQSTQLPMLIYNLPLAGMMSNELVINLSRIDNVQGLKYTGTDLYTMQKLKDSIGKNFKIYGGADELASSNIAIGVDGIIGSFYNIFPDLFINIFNSIRIDNDANKANEYQKNAVRLILYMLEQGSMMGAIKGVLRRVGVEAGYVRRPFDNFDGDELDKIVEGLLDIAQKYEIEDVHVIEKLKRKGNE